MAATIISSLSSPTSDMLTFSSLTISSYRVITLSVWGVKVGTDNTAIRLQVSQSGSFLSGASDYMYASFSRSSSGTFIGDGSAANSSIFFSSDNAGWAVGNAAGEVFATRVELVNMESGNPRYFSFNNSHVRPDGNVVLSTGGGMINNSTEIDGLRILLDGGTMTAGKAVLIGHT